MELLSREVKGPLFSIRVGVCKETEALAFLGRYVGLPFCLTVSWAF